MNGFAPALVAWSLLLLGGLPAAAHSLEELEDELSAREPYVEIVDRPAPDFDLLDSGGRTVRLADFRGKVVVLNFIYAGCPDICPLHSERIAQIQKMVDATPMRDIVEFITVTTDPERDTPDVMKAYGTAHGLDPANWLFLTSGADRPTATREIAHAYGLEFTAIEGGMQMHGVVTHLIDKSGHLRARYHGLKFNSTNLVVHINALTNDYH